MSRSDTSREVSVSVSSDVEAFRALARSGRRASPPCGAIRRVAVAVDAHAATSTGDQAELLELGDDRSAPTPRARAPRCRARAPGRRLLVRVVDAGEALDLAARTPSRRGPSRRGARTRRPTPRRTPRRTAPNSSTSARAFRRVSSYGEIAAAITAPPWRVSRDATQPIRSMFVSRSSFEKPRPFERWVRTVSPSRYSTTWPRRSSSGPTRCAIVVLPEPERPVNQSVKPPSRLRSDSGCSWA